MSDGQMDLFAWADTRPTAKIIIATERWRMRDRANLWQAAYAPPPNLNADIVDLSTRRRA